jgi:hypothetical protein
MDYTEHDVHTLAAKLESLALEPGEQAALDALIATAEAETDEVAGFSFNPAATLGGRIGNILVVSVATTASGNPQGVATTASGNPEGVATTAGGNPEG